MTLNCFANCGMWHMATPMASNLNLLRDASSELVDATMYHQMIGSLMYLTNTRPNIFFTVNKLRQLLTIAKHAVRYLKGTIVYGIKYNTNQKTNLHSYVDSDWVDNTTERKRTLGCFFSLRSNMIYRFGRMQSCMALSIAEEKYVSTCSAI